MALYAKDVKAARRASLRTAPEATLIDRPQSALSHVREAWRERRLLPWLGVRIITRIFAGAKLGRAWLLIRPLMDTLGKALIYGGILAAPSANNVPYFIFLTVGMTGWMLFQRSVYFATRSLNIYRRLMREFNFPLLLAPISVSALGIVEMGFYFLIAAGAFGYYWYADGVLYLEIGPQLLYGVAGLAGCLVFSWVLGIWLSVLNAKAEDVRLTLRYVLGFWLYLTPIIYPFSAIPPQYQGVASVNPMAPWIELVKKGFLGAGELRPVPLLWSMGLIVVIGVSGVWYFNREAQRSMDDDSRGFTDEEDEL